MWMTRVQPATAALWAAPPSNNDSLMHLASVRSEPVPTTQGCLHCCSKWFTIPTLVPGPMVSRYTISLLMSACGRPRFGSWRSKSEENQHGYTFVLNHWLTEHERENPTVWDIPASSTELIPPGHWCFWCWFSHIAVLSELHSVMIRLKSGQLPSPHLY